MSSTECLICTEPFDPIDHQPMIMKCTHGLCLQCVIQLKPFFAQSSDYELTCPECRQVTFRSSLILNRPLLDVITSISVAVVKSIENEPLCDRCVSDKFAFIPTTHCFLCEHWLCAYHTQRHIGEHKTNDELHSYDEVVANPDLQARVAQQIRAMVTRCLVHTSFILGQHCVDCDQLVCDQCIHSDHATHLNVDIYTAVSNLMENSDLLIKGVAQIENNVSAHMDDLIEQQQAIESVQNVLNAMSDKIAQLGSELCARDLRLVDEMKSMSATLESISLARRQLEDDLAVRDFNKLRVSVKQLQSCYDSCSGLLTSHHPVGHVSDSEMLSSLLNANALLSVCDPACDPPSEHDSEQKDIVVQAPPHSRPQPLFSADDQSTSSSDDQANNQSNCVDQPQSSNELQTDCLDTRHLLPYRPSIKQSIATWHDLSELAVPMFSLTVLNVASHLLLGAANNEVVCGILYDYVPIQFSLKVLLLTHDQFIRLIDVLHYHLVMLPILLCCFFAMNFVLKTSVQNMHRRNMNVTFKDSDYLAGELNANFSRWAFGMIHVLFCLVWWSYVPGHRIVSDVLDLKVIFEINALFWCQDMLANVALRERSQSNRQLTFAMGMLWLSMFCMFGDKTLLPSLTPYGAAIHSVALACLLIANVIQSWNAAHGFIEAHGEQLAGLKNVFRLVAFFNRLLSTLLIVPAVFSTIEHFYRHIQSNRSTSI